MVADQSRLLTGSYNWTRGASEYNQENILITNDPKLIGHYARAFESLWGALGARP
jgi:cardiolipin hydrolase